MAVSLETGRVRWDVAPLPRDKKQATVLLPQRARAHYNLGLYYVNQGMRDDAYASFQKATQLSPPIVEAWVQVGLIQMELGKQDEAVASFSTSFDTLMGKLAGKPPLVFSKAKMSEASRLRSRLALYYKRRRKMYAQDFPEFFDADLHKLFVDAAAAPENERAATFLRRSRKVILNAVSEWTGEPKFTLNNLLRALTDRCAELDLRLRSQAAGIEVTAFLATLAAHYRLTGKFKES